MVAVRAIAAMEPPQASSIRQDEEIFAARLRWERYSVMVGNRAKTQSVAADRMPWTYNNAVNASSLTHWPVKCLCTRSVGRPHWKRARKIPTTQAEQ